MSTYNDAKYLRRAIESVLSQNFSNWEFIIYDDASTDDGVRIINEYTMLDRRVKLIRNKNNIGLATNLNSGIKLSKGKYIARIDGDDFWTNKDKLNKQLQFLNAHQEYGLIGTYAHAIDQNGKYLYDIIYPEDNLNIKQNMFRHNCFVHSSVMIPKYVFDNIGLYDENLLVEDYDLFLRIGVKYKIYNIPHFYVNYTINPSGITVTKYKKQIEDTLKVIKKYKNSYPNYETGFLLWNLRKFYPKWLKGTLSMKIINILK